MLKIKDDVDLRILEVDGFEKDGFGNYVLYNEGEIELKISMKTRKIAIPCYRYNYIINLDTLYDLIESNLVDKE